MASYRRASATWYIDVGEKYAAENSKFINRNERGIRKNRDGSKSAVGGNEGVVSLCVRE